ncbi:MAG TPA: sulfatase-like hydrolase/transferase [Candidatus Limnocylindria bacterium]|jgi:arylsulfatase A-like enzyme
MHYDNRMNRWVAVVATAVAASLFVVLLLAGERRDIGTAVVQPQAHRPNIILVVADDLDVALFDTLTGMPSVPDGRSFQLMFDTTPLCCPSKTSILRGQYSHSHGVLRNNPPDGGLARALELGLESSTVATWLDQAGYETGFVGRYLLGYGRRDTDASYIPPGWDHWAARISSIAEGYEDGEFSIDGKPTRLSGNVDTAALELARGMIADAGDRPYFVMIATQAPHWPWPVRNDPTTRGQTMPPVEDLVEQLLSEVGPDTYVIFTSDNGFHTEPTAGKSLPYDTDTIVPLVVWGPDVQPGVDDDHIVANIDLAPTFADWAGVTPPAFVEGSSMVPLTQGKSPAWRDQIQLELVGTWQAIRTKTLLTIDWAGGRHEVIPVSDVPPAGG